VFCDFYRFLPSLSVRLTHDNVLYNEPEEKDDIK
jgi:hypothetical protein